jgi:hypothetical protein
MNIYQAAFKDNGQNIELQVRENGTIFFDPRRKYLSAAGASAAGVKGQSSGKYPGVSASVPLSGSQKVDKTTLPQAVERTIQDRAGSNRIEDVERGSWNGIQVYEIAFHDKGKLVELQVDEQGNVVFDPRSK